MSELFKKLNGNSIPSPPLSYMPTGVSKRKRETKKDALNHKQKIKNPKCENTLQVSE
jgi:hypothetical protein